MNYRKKNYRGKRSYSGRPHRRSADSYHQPMPPDQNRIPYTRHTLTKPDVEAVVDALLSGTLTQGRELDRFESLLAKLTHSEHAIAFNTGTAAIHGALACLKLEPEDEVIIPTMTFCSIANMVELVGARFVLVDCDPKTMTMSVDAVRAAVTEHTKAIFTNNFAGHASNLLELRDICDDHNLILLEDASHGLGGKYRGHYVGNHADLTCFSFHPSKAITTCEGGAVTTNNRQVAEWLRQFRQHGIQKDSRHKEGNDLPGYYQELQFAGMNYRMSEVHAALGRSQLTRLDRHIERRRSIAQVYFQKLGEHPDIQLPQNEEWADNAYHLFPVQFVNRLENSRDQIYNDLKDAGIDVQVHYVPIHRMPLYASDYHASDFPNAETYFSRCLSLPLYCDLSYKDIERILEALNQSIKQIIGEDEPEDVAVDGEDVDTDSMDESVEASDEAPVDDHDDGDDHADDSFDDRDEASEDPSEADSADEAEDAESAPAADDSFADDTPAADVTEAPAEAAPVEDTPAEESEEAPDEAAIMEAPSDTSAMEAVEPEEAPKPRRRTTRSRKTTADGEEKPKRRTTRTRKAAASEGEEGEAEKKPTRRRTTRTRKTTTSEAPVDGDKPAEEEAKPVRRRRTTRKTAETAAEGEEKPKPVRRTRKKKVEPAPESESPSED